MFEARTSGGAQKKKTKAPWQIEKEKRDAERLAKIKASKEKGDNHNRNNSSSESLPKQPNRKPALLDRRGTATSVSSIAPVFRRMGANPWNRDGDQFDDSDDDKDEIDEWGDGNELIAHSELKRLRKEASTYKKKFEVLASESEDFEKEKERMEKVLRKARENAEKSALQISRLSSQVQALKAAMKNKGVEVPDHATGHESDGAAVTPGLLSLDDLPASLFSDGPLNGQSKKKKRKKKKKSTTKGGAKAAASADNARELSKCRAELEQAKSDRKRLAEIIATMVGGNENLAALIKDSGGASASASECNRSPPSKMGSAHRHAKKERAAPLSVNERPPFVSHVGKGGHKEFNMRLIDENAFSVMHAKREVLKVVRRRKVVSETKKKRGKTRTKTLIKKNSSGGKGSVGPMSLTGRSRLDQYYQSMNLESQRHASNHVASFV